MKTHFADDDNVPQEPFKAGDCGYIDGYVLGGHGSPCAVVVGDNGQVGLVPTYMLKATGSFVQTEQSEES